MKGRVVEHWNYNNAHSTPCESRHVRLYAGQIWVRAFRALQLLVYVSRDASSGSLWSIYITWMWLQAYRFTEQDPIPVVEQLGGASRP